MLAAKHYLRKKARLIRPQGFSGVCIKMQKYSLKIIFFNISSAIFHLSLHGVIEWSVHLPQCNIILCDSIMSWCEPQNTIVLTLFRKIVWIDALSNLNLHCEPLVYSCYAAVSPNYLYCRCVNTGYYSSVGLHVRWCVLDEATPNWEHPHVM